MAAYSSAGLKTLNAFIIPERWNMYAYARSTLLEKNGGMQHYLVCCSKC